VFSLLCLLFKLSARGPHFSRERQRFLARRNRLSTPSWTGKSSLNDNDSCSRTIARTRQLWRAPIPSQQKRSWRVIAKTSALVRAREALEIRLGSRCCFLAIPSRLHFRERQQRRWRTTHSEHFGPSQQLSAFDLSADAADGIWGRRPADQLCFVAAAALLFLPLKKAERRSRNVVIPAAEADRRIAFAAVIVCNPPLRSRRLPANSLAKPERRRCPRALPGRSSPRSRRRPSHFIEEEQLQFDRLMARVRRVVHCPQLRHFTLRCSRAPFVRSAEPDRHSP
jgi:hypothetical protein